MLQHNVRNSQQDFLFTDWYGFDIFYFKGKHVNDQVNISVEQVICQLGGIALHQLQVDIRKAVLKDRQDFRQDDATSGVGKPQGELTHREVLDIGKLAVGLVPQLQHLSGLSLQCLTGIGQGQGRGAVEEDDIEFFFHIGDMVA